MNTIFMGTPEFSVPSLVTLSKNSNVVLVVTQPDRRQGRGKKLSYSPVKKKALELGLEVIQPEIVKGRRFAQRIAEYHPDVIVTAAYGRILGPALLAVPRYGCINVHASILPRYRGAAPINRAIINGDSETGVSIMQTVSELDAGDIFKIVKTKIKDGETTGLLTTRLSEIGAKALIDVLQNIENITPLKQNEKDASYAPQLKKQDGLIDWSRIADEVSEHVRGMHPWPCAFTVLQGKILKIHEAIVLQDEILIDKEPGTVWGYSKNGIDVVCGFGILRITSMQLPGKKQLTASQFFSGVKITPGIRLG